MRLWFSILVLIVLFCLGSTALLSRNEFELPPVVSGSTAESLPDLVVSRAQNSLDPSKCFTVGDPTFLIAWVSNQGQGDAGPFDVNIAGTLTSVPQGLKAGEQVQVMVDYTAENQPFGVEVDPSNAVVESDETNNTYSAYIVTLTPPAPCTPTPWPTQTPTPTPAA